MINASVQFLYNASASWVSPTYSNVKILVTNPNTSPTVISFAPSVGDFIIDVEGYVWKLTNVANTVVANEFTVTLECKNLSHKKDSINETSAISSQLGNNAIVTPVDGLLPVSYNSLFININVFRAAEQYNNSLGEVFVKNTLLIKKSATTTNNNNNFKTHNVNTLDFNDYEEAYFNNILIDSLSFKDDTATIGTATTVAVKITLPNITTIKAGHYYIFTDSGNNFSDYKVGIVSSGIDKIQGEDSSILLDIDGSSTKFTYSGDIAIGWVIQ